MNINELEKLARAWTETPTVVNRTTFSNAANPAAILELIERYRKMKSSLERIAKYPQKSGDELSYTMCRLIANEALARANGESNE